jgi:D-alanyl-D-alanine carboxypeptidase/D-alanyl-D-alanine-endopeptidase (penicillin-binding protein 4)
VTRTVAVLSPAHYYLSALKYTLAAEGIDTDGCGVKELRGIVSPAQSLLWTDYSLPLSGFLKPLLKTSQNLFAETLTRTLGLTMRGEGTFAMGKEVVEETLDRMGVDRDSYVYADGSGLSRLNLTSPHTLIQILRFLHQHPRFADFYSALSIAGIDGTLETRLTNTKAQNNVHAKTGSIANVSAISGYVRSADGELLAFSILANSFLASRDKAEYLEDKALERLANFSRK